MKDVNVLIENGVDVQQSLELFGDMEMYDETLNDFLDMHEEKLGNLQKFLDGSDMPNYAIEVHSLKSSSKYVGLTKLSEIAYQHELKSKENDIGYINDHFFELKNEYLKDIEIIKNYVRS